MREHEKHLMELIRGTAIENNKAELTHLRKLPPREQLEVGMVMYAAMHQKKTPSRLRNEKLAEVRNVVDAQRFLDSSRAVVHK
jgi:hypothetical protein